MNSSRILVGAVLLLSTVAGSAGIVVQAGDDGSGSLRSVIQAAAPGELITFAAPLSGATITLTAGQLVIDKDLVIDASGLAVPVIVDANGEVTGHRVLQILPAVTVTLDSLVLTGGVTEDGGLAGESGADGGGIHNAGNLTLRNVEVRGNTTGAGASSTGEDELFFGGTGGRGGGVFNAGELILEDVAICGNITGSGGDGIGAYYYRYEVFDETYYLELPVTGGAGGCGGGLCNLGTVEVRRSVIEGNATGSGGEGLPDPRDGFADGMPGSGGSGGGLHNESQLVVEGSGLRNNAAAGGRGGGLFISGGTAFVRRTTVSGNCSGVRGGGGIFFADGFLLLEASTLSGNRTGDGMEFGGAGGGIRCENGYLTLRSVTVCGNRTGDGGVRGGSGGGVFLGGGETFMFGCTVTGNTAGQGGSTPGGVGGLYGQDGKLRLENSIIAGNSAGAGEPDFELGGTSLKVGGRNLLSGDPQLAPLGDYGGGTPVRPPYPSSPAVNGGVVTEYTPATDQRGWPRVAGPALDLGAVETGGQGYLDWALATFPAGADASFTGDADADGLSNGLAFATGGEPLRIHSHGPEGVDLSFGCRPEVRAEVVFRVFRSGDLRDRARILRVEGEVIEKAGAADPSFTGSRCVLRDEPELARAFYLLEVELAGP